MSEITDPKTFLTTMKNATMNSDIMNNGSGTIPMTVKPKKIFDIYGDEQYHWYESSSNIDRKNIPFVIMQEFENKTDLLTQKQLYIAQAVVENETVNNSKNFIDIYKELYLVVPTGRSFRFPYFGKYPFSIDTTYSMIDPRKTDYLGTKVSETRTALENVAEKFTNEMDAFFSAVSLDRIDKLQRQLKTARDAVSIEEQKKSGIDGYYRRFGLTEGAQAIKTYSSSQTGQYETTFTLINKTQDDVQINYNFIMTMMMALAPSYPNTMMVKVPYVYEIYIPSVIHIPLGFIGSFSATPKGSSYISGQQHYEYHTARNNSIPIGMIVPEAWEIKIVFNNLFPISVQLLNTIAEPFGTNFGFSPTKNWYDDPGYENDPTNATYRLKIPTSDNYIQGLE